MKVIVNRDMPNLGEEGDILDVSAGYARNYLLPQGIVLQHNAQNLALIEGRRAAIEQRKEAKRQDAASLQERLENETLTITMMAGENGRLFGSVTAATIVDELAKLGIDVEKKRVDIPDSSLKATGNYKVRVRLYGDAEAFLSVTVEGNTQHAEASRGRAAAPAADAPAEEAPADEEAVAEDAPVSDAEPEPEMETEAVAEESVAEETVEDESAEAAEEEEPKAAATVEADAEETVADDETAEEEEPEAAE